MTTPTTPPPHKDRSWIILAVGFAAVWGVYLAFFAPENTGLVTKAPTGPVADYSWKLKSIDGKTVPFSDYKGKLVFLNVWATWCQPCIKEMPSIAALANNPKLKDVAFVCVSAGEEVETVRQFVADRKWPMTVLVASEAPAVFLTDSIPATFIVAPDGKVVGSSTGAEEWDQPKFVTMLTDLLKPKDGPGAAQAVTP